MGEDGHKGEGDDDKDEELWSVGLILRRNSGNSTS
jgi:hypothetical protein